MPDLKTSVLKSLTKDPTPKHTIVAKVGAKPGAVSTALESLKQDGKARSSRGRHGGWALVCLP